MVKIFSVSTSTISVTVIFESGFGTIFNGPTGFSKEESKCIIPIETPTISNA